VSTEWPTRAELYEFLNHVVGVLDRLNIPYMVVGGLAAIIHGAPRFTRDADIVVDMQLHHIGPFVAEFPLDQGYYADEYMIADSLIHGQPFNVLQSYTGAKIDLVPLSAGRIDRDAFARRVQLVYDLELERKAWFARAEDVIIAKLVAFHNTGSQKHAQDAHNVLAVNWHLVSFPQLAWSAKASGVQAELESMLEVVARDLGEPPPSLGDESPPS
jgi:hypothetical protein